MLRLALALNGAALLWAFIAFEYAYIGIITGVSAIVWFFVLLKKKQDELEAGFEKRFSGIKTRCLDKRAFFKAQQSRGYSQAQGTGCLVLTDDELHFEMQLPGRVLSIPVSSITNVGQANRLLGVGSWRAMLIVEYRDAGGNRDSIALNVKKLELWKGEIRQVMSEHAKQPDTEKDST